MSIYVLDAPMGIGKTSAMINYMREAPADEHFVFVTPFLSEGERIIAECPEKEFVSPETYGYNEFGTPVSTDYKSKMDDFKDKIRDGRNIATTHALFQRFDQEARDLISVGNYTLVMDEVCDLISDYEITPYDAGTLSEKYIDVEDNGRAIWRADETEYKGRFRRYKDDCELGILWYYNRTSYIQMLPKESFEVFKDCYIMTYLFEAQLQRCYFDLQGLEYETIYVEGDTPETYHITGDQREYKLLHIRDKVHIFGNAKMNRIGDGRYDLSRGWYEDADNTDNVKQVQDNAYNFFRNKMKAKSTDCLWTCYLDSLLRDMVGSTDTFPELRETQEFVTTMNIVQFLKHNETTKEVCKQEVFKALRLRSNGEATLYELQIHLQIGHVHRNVFEKIPIELLGTPKAIRTTT